MANITFDQAVGSTGNRKNISTTRALSSAVLSGQLLTLCSASVLPSTVTDSLGNTWALAVSDTGGGGTQNKIAIWYALNSNSGTPTVTITFASTSTDDFAIGVQAWLGASSQSGVLIQTGSTSATSSNMGNGSLTVSTGNLVLANWGRPSGGTLRSGPSGYSSAAFNDSTRYATFYKLMAASSGTETPVLAFTAAGFFNSVIAEFKNNSGDGGGATAVANPFRMLMMGVH